MDYNELSEYKIYAQLGSDVRERIFIIPMSGCIDIW